MEAGGYAMVEMGAGHCEYDDLMIDGDMPGDLTALRCASVRKARELKR